MAKRLCAFRLSDDALNWMAELQAKTGDDKTKIVETDLEGKNERILFDVSQIDL